MLHTSEHCTTCTRLYITCSWLLNNVCSAVCCKYKECRVQDYLTHCWPFKEKFLPRKYVPQGKYPAIPCPTKPDPKKHPFSSSFFLPKQNPAQQKSPLPQAKILLKTNYSLITCAPLFHHSPLHPSCTIYLSKITFQR